METRKVIDSIGTFLRVVKHFYPEDSKAFFRGQENSSFDVSSSIFRLFQEINFGEDSKGAYRLANSLFAEFRKNAPAFEEVHSLKNYQLNELDLTMVAQHYGLSTRLIDWTKSPLVALYFATEYGKPGTDCSVFMLADPGNQNLISISSSDSFVASVQDEQERLLEIQKLFEGRTLEQISSKEINDVANVFTSKDMIYPPIQINPKIFAIHIPSLMHRLDKPTGVLHQVLTEDVVNTLAPLASVQLYGEFQYIIEPLPLNPRIKNQQGVFLFSKNITEPAFSATDISVERILNTSSEDDWDDKERNSSLIRIDIPGEYASAIQKELSFYGLTRDFIYPELPSFTKAMQQREVEKYLRGRV